MRKFKCEGFRAHIDAEDYSDAASTFAALAVARHGRNSYHLGVRSCAWGWLISVVIPIRGSRDSRLREVFLNIEEVLPRRAK